MSIAPASPAEPFVLFDDARPGAGSLRDGRPARLYQAPVEIIVARRPQEVLPALERIEALASDGHHLAGYLAYEAGLALEPRLAPLLAHRAGADGPLLWFGAFTGFTPIAAPDVPGWLAEAAGGREAAIGPLTPQLSPGGYSQAFERVQAAIAAGDIYQANLTFPLAGSWTGDPLQLYRALRAAGSGGYGGVLSDGGQWLLSFSPEMLFQLEQGTITARPMKGTRPRGRDPGEDLRLRDELAASVKDRAENLMIVDLLRNDVSRVAEPGSVRTHDPFTIESYPTVHQMVTTIQARLSPGKTAVDLLRALFPCGSITGAPKIRAMELIAAIERDPRGPYCGSMGWIDPSGDAAFNVAIRTARLVPGENGSGRAVLGVGAAVVADSQALPEWRECLVKGGFVQQSGEGAAARFDLIETMRFTPEEGIPLLEVHLERIGASAHQLGFTFDRHAVRNAIQALCFDADRPCRLRLVSARSGAYSLELTDLPPELPSPLLCAVLPMPLDSGDWRLRHKTSDRHLYNAGLAAARAAGGHEALLLRDDGRLTEGCFTNIFLERDGVLLTPPASLGLLPGVLRRSLIEAGRATEADLTLGDLAQGFFVGNALRGLMPARLLT